MASTVDHPGLFLARELETLGVSPTELARQLKVPANRFSQIINGKRSITGDSALRLAHWFGNTPDFWMNLQAQYDLRVATLEVGREVRALPTRLKVRVSGFALPGKGNQGRASHGRN
jgi:addiction module HigA family antidote